VAEMKLVLFLTTPFHSCGSANWCQLFCSFLFLELSSIQPSTIVSGFQKFGDYPFDPTAIKPHEISNSESAAMTKSRTTSTPQDEFESSQVESSRPLAVSFSENQIKEEL